MRLTASEPTPRAASASPQLALAADAARECAVRSLPGATESLGAAGLEALVKGLGSSDTGLNGRVLIIMNELHLGALLAYCLTAAGFRIQLVDRDVDGALAVMRDVPDVVLLDSRLPDFRSTEIWRQVRAADNGQPPPAIVMFIRSEADIDPRLGLELGPCDFVLYPFSVRDLALRVDSMVRLRRESIAHAPPARRHRRYLIGPIDLDVDRHVVLVNGGTLHLSALEMRLLAYLVEHRDRVCTRADLLKDVWGYRAGVVTRAADIHVKRLRDKLGRVVPLIDTVRGAGYRLSPDFPVVVKG